MKIRSVLFSLDRLHQTYMFYPASQVHNPVPAKCMLFLTPNNHSSPSFLSGVPFTSFTRQGLTMYSRLTFSMTFYTLSLLSLEVMDICHHIQPNTFILSDPSESTLRDLPRILLPYSYPNVSVFCHHPTEVPALTLTWYSSP